VIDAVFFVVNVNDIYNFKLSLLDIKVITGMNKLIYGLLLALFFTNNLYAQGYALTENDLVLITVHEYPDLKTRARIGDEGKINFPLLGTIKISDMSVKQAEHFIEESLKNGNYIKSPQVTIFIEEFRGETVSVLGMINNPGKYSIVESGTLMEVLAEAGGIAKDGNTKVIITRKGQEPFAVDTSLILEQGDMKRNIEISKGDIIYVPRMDVFYIYGQVNEPGEYRLHPNLTIQQALSVSGGLTGKGTERGLKIKRKNLNGEVETIDATIFDELIPNDVIYVKESLF
jgi:polysaccharide export outer membrane protein